MLRELYIENLAVIKKASISFCDNLNIFTGETGAGKSILINGINAILGQRTTKDIVRTGCDKAVISALFTDIPKDTMDKLNEYGLSCEDNQITITREISSDGGSVARINMRIVNITVLKEIGETLINIHGQHDNQILLKPEKHIEILDNFGSLGDILNDYRECFKILQDTAREINNLVINEKEKELRVKELQEHINEIEELEISENEDKEIEDEFNHSKNFSRLFEGLNNSNILLCGNDDISGSIVDVDNSAEKLIAMVDIMPELEPLSKRLKDASIELDDISSEISHIISKIDISPERFEYITKRRELLNKIKRKYGPELSDVINYYNKSVSELEQLTGNESKLEVLKENKAMLLNEVTIKAKNISVAREQASERFIKQVTNELAFLDMPSVKLEVLQTKGKLTVHGMDNIEFLISANIGEPPKPIAKIASGGELSRIMLALKNVLADKDNIPTLIFDEIDTGVSGRAAQKIGIKLEEISKFRQVLCVTHLAQIAVMADNHLYIEKNVVDNVTVTQVTTLDFNDRKKEIARIMGGDNITDLMLKNAEELITTSKKLVKN